MRKLILMLSLLLMSACSSNTDIVTQQNLHPKLPPPIYCEPLLQKEVSVNKDGSVLLSPRAILKRKKCDIEIERYLKSILSILCFYRSDLNELRCRDDQSSKED